MPWLNKRWISFFISSAVLGVVLVFVVGWANNQEGIKLRNKFDSYTTDSNLTSDSTDLVLEIGVQVNSFDPNGKTGPALGVQLSYAPFLNPDTQLDNLPFAIQIIVQQQTFNFSANATLPDHSFSLNAPGNPNSYPFDLYDASIDIQVSILPNGFLPLVVFSQGAVQGFTYTTNFQSSSDGSEVSIDFYVQRSTTTRVFAAIVFLLMWCLSLSIFVAAMQPGSEERRLNFLWLLSQPPCSLRCPIYETVSPAYLLQLGLQKIWSAFSGISCLSPLVRSSCWSNGFCRMQGLHPTEWTSKNDVRSTSRNYELLAGTKVM